MASILSKFNAPIPLTEIIKIPSMRNKVEIFSRVQGKLGVPPILLQANHLRQTNEEYPPFFISMELNDMCLHNCMLDSGALTNVMTLKVMKQLGLEVTRPYGNVCRIDSKAIGMCGLIEDLEVFLARYPEIVIVVMGVVVLDVLDKWGMILYGKWAATLGGTLHMDLSYATIPIGDESHAILYNQPKKRMHVEDPVSDYELDISLEEVHPKEPIDSPLNFDLYDLTFA